MKNLIGQKFGRLTVVSKYDNSNDIGKKRVKWICKCDCGNISIVRSDSLELGKIRSCGCSRNNLLNHYGLDGNRIYTIWRRMKDRCYNNKSKSFSCYGGRGIKVCDEWLTKFDNFYNWAINGGYKKTLTLDRIDTNDDYCPENCRWATMREQNNNRRNNHYIEYNGEKLTLTQWANRYGVNPNTLRSRLKSGKSLKNALINNGIAINNSVEQIIKHIDEVYKEVKLKSIKFEKDDCKYISEDDVKNIISKIKKKLQSW